MRARHTWGFGSPRRRSFGEWLLDQWDDWLWGVIKFLMVIGLIAWGVNSCATSEWYLAERRVEAAQEAADAQPRVIREVDGCKVYTFKSGGQWHYFTRCPSTTTTEAWRSVTQGKTTRQVSESITTENAK